MNLSTLQADTHFLCGSTSANYSPSNLIRNLNVAYNDVARTIWESDGDWHYDDSNNTDAPVAYKTVSNASASYTIPTTALRVLGVEIKDVNSDWWKLTPISYNDLTQSPEEFRSAAGLPKYYQLEGNEIRLFPPPGTGSVTMSSGMCVRLSRDVTQFVTSVASGGMVPGFATPFHRILSYAAAIDFTQDEQQRKFLVAERARLESGLKRFYSTRADGYKTQMKPAGKKFWRQYQ